MARLRINVPHTLDAILILIQPSSIPFQLCPPFLHHITLLFINYLLHSTHIAPCFYKNTQLAQCISLPSQVTGLLLLSSQTLVQGNHLLRGNIHHAIMAIYLLAHSCHPPCQMQTRAPIHVNMLYCYIGTHEHTLLCTLLCFPLAHCSTAGVLPTSASFLLHHLPLLHAHHSHSQPMSDQHPMVPKRQTRQMSSN